MKKLWRTDRQTNRQTSQRKTQLYRDENRRRFFCLLRIIQESGVYQLGVPQGQGDSSAPSTTDPLICGFCLVTTPNTRGKTVEQSIVTWMFVWEFITNNRHPGEPQLTNKPCTNRRLREKHNCIVMKIDEDSSAYSESFKRVECTDGQTDGTIHRAAWSQLKTTEHFFYAASSFVHHFIAIIEFKLEFQLQSGNAKFGSKSTIFLAVWPWNYTDDLEKQ